MPTKYTSGGVVCFASLLCLVGRSFLYKDYRTEKMDNASFGCLNSSFNCFCGSFAWYDSSLLLT